MLSTSEKRAIKNYLLSIDPHCMWCGKWLHNDDGHVHPVPPGSRVATLEHILAKEDGGGDEPSNLGIACYECNCPTYRRTRPYAMDVLDREARHLYRTPV